VVVYLDDGIGAAQGQLKVEQDAFAIQGDQDLSQTCPNASGHRPNNVPGLALI